MKIQLISLGRTIHDFQSKKEFMSAIVTMIEPTGIPTFYVMPEYAWGNFSVDNIMEEIVTIQNMLEEAQMVVFGSTYRIIENTRLNSAIVITKNEINFIDKTHVLEEEKLRNEIKEGRNSGSFMFHGIKVAIIICADIWDNKLLNRLVKEEGAELLLVPAMTVVPNKFGLYARAQWHALSLVRSREYLIPVVIADHHTPQNDDYDVGGGSSIANPSNKTQDMKDIASFLNLPVNGVCRASIDLTDISNYRHYRISKGLFSV